MKLMFLGFLFALRAQNTIGATLGATQAEELLSSLPFCAGLCISTIVPQSPCALTDITCVCSNKALLNNISACVQSNCTVRETLTTTNTTLTACNVPPRSQSNVQIVVASTFCVLAIAACFLRLVAHPPWTKSFGFEDFLACVAAATLVPITGMDIFAARIGLGRDVWTVKFRNIDRLLKSFYINEMLYLFVTIVTKLSLLLFYLRVFPATDFRRLVHVLMVVCLCHGLAFMPAIIFQCSPISLFWTGWDGEHAGKCANSNAMVWALSGINITLDVIVIALPLPSLLKLNLSLRKKIYVVAMFGVGFLITLISILRLQTLVKFGNTSNVTWYFTRVGYWSSIEVDMSVICICMPAVVQAFHKAASVNSQSSTAQDGYLKHNDIVAPGRNESAAGRPKNFLSINRSVKTEGSVTLHEIDTSERSLTRSQDGV